MQEESEKIYVIGNTTIKVIPPKISEEERERRWNEAERTALEIWKNIHINKKLKETKKTI